MLLPGNFAPVVLLAVAIITLPLRGDDNPPLIVLQMSEERLNRHIHEIIERETVVDDVILATHVVGTAKTTGKPQIHLVESDAGPTINAVFRGTTVSHTMGHHSPVVIFSHTRTDFTVEKLVAIEQMGDVASYPTKIQSTTGTVTENITTHRRGLLGRIVLRAAARAVAASEPQANAIAQRDVERQVVTAFDEALESRIEKMKTQISLRDLVAKVLPPDATHTYRSITKGGYLTVAVFAHAPEATIDEANLPKLPVNNQPVQLWMHKSVAGEDFSAAKSNVDVVRHWLAFPLLLGLAAAEEPQRDAQWITVGDWLMMQMSRLEK